MPKAERQPPQALPPAKKSRVRLIRWVVNNAPHPAEGSRRRKLKLKPPSMSV